MAGYNSNYLQVHCLITILFITAGQIISANTEPCGALPCIPKSLHGNPKNCSSYFTCSNDGNKFRHISCPLGQKFDSKLLRCAADKVICQQACTIKENSASEANLASDLPLTDVPIRSVGVTSSTSPVSKSPDGFTRTDGMEDVSTANGLNADEKYNREVESSSQTSASSVTTSKASTSKIREANNTTMNVKQVITSSLPKTSLKSTSAPVTTTVSPTTIVTLPSTTTLRTTAKKSTTVVSNTSKTMAISTAKKTVSDVPPKPQPSQGGATVTTNLTGTERESPLSGRRMDPNTDSATPPIGVIVSVIAAALVLIGVIVAVIVVCKRKRRNLSDHDIVKIENPHYKGPHHASGNGSSGPSLVVRNYRFSRDFDLYDGSAALSTSTNSISRGNQTRQAPPPPDPFDNDNADQQPMVEMTTFMEKPPEKPPEKINLQDSASDGDMQNYTPDPDHINAGTSDPLIGHNDTDISDYLYRIGSDGNVTSLDSEYVSEKEDPLEWDDDSRTHKTFGR